MRRWEDGAREDLRRILQAALLAVTPQVFLRERVRADGGAVWILGRPADLRASATRVAAIGKAAAGMAAQCAWAGGVERLLVTPDASTVPGWASIRARHPYPDAASVEAGERLLSMAERSGPDDLLVLLLSGGASSLCEAPLVPLEDLVATTQLLLRSGATIAETNAVRKHLSRIKGGRLAEACRGRVLALLLSDVPGDDPSLVASGPVSPDPSTFRDAVEALRSRGVWRETPASVRDRLEAGLAGEVPETPKPGDRALERADVRVVAGNGTALEAAAREAVRLGYMVEVRPDGLRGEARRMGEALASLGRRALAEASSDGRPRALVVGGETTVTVRGSGRGGRNQETVLASVDGIAGRPILLASVGTDGVDGPTDAAGAVADGYTLARAGAAGLVVEEHLAENDAYPFFAALDDLVRTGPTGTNVMDVAIVLAGSPPARRTA